MFLFLFTSILTVGSLSSIANADADAPREASPVGKIIKTVCEGQLDGSFLEAARKRWQGKIIVLNSDVVLNDPYAVFKYPGTQIYLPLIVLDEIIAKKDDSILGDAAETFIRILDDLKTSARDKDGFELPHGSRLILNANDHLDILRGTTFAKQDRKDNHIVALTKFLTENNSGKEVVLITDSLSVSARAMVLNLNTTGLDYEWLGGDEEIPPQYVDFQVSDDELKTFLTTGELKKPENLAIKPNQFVRLSSPNQPPDDDTVARYVYNRENPELSALRALFDFEALGLENGPKNLEQHMALDLMFDPSVDLVFVESEAGAGKSYLGLLAGLIQTFKLNNPLFYRYSRFMITRPLVDVDKQNTLGPVPGGIKEKMQEDFNAFYDNLAVLVPKVKSLFDKKASPKAKNAPAVPESRWEGVEPDPQLQSASAFRRASRYVASQLRKKEEQDARAQQASSRPPEIKPFDPDTSLINLELLPMAKIRGRSLHFTNLLSDENQNASGHATKTLLTRLAEGSKVVLLGDPSQIDPQYLTRRNNGFSMAVRIFVLGNWMSEEEQSRIGYVHLRTVVRSPVSNLTVKGYKLHQRKTF